MDGSLSYSPPELLPGEVWLVGAGPGDPGLISWLARSALAQADAVIHDAGVDPAILALVPPGRLTQPSRPAGNQGSAIERCIRLARDGWRVVRLIEGDPLAMAGGVGEALSLSAALLRFRIVPGITASIAGPALAGVPVTHRGVNTAVHFLDLDEGDDLSALPVGGSDAVVAMLRPGQLRGLAARLRASGVAESTPILVLTDAGRATQAAYETTLADPILPGLAGLERRIVAVIGAVVALRRQLTLPNAPVPANDQGLAFSMAGIAG